VSLVASAREFGPGLVHLGRAVAGKGERDPMACPGHRLPAWVEGTDGVLGVPGQTQPAAQFNLSVRLIIGLRRNVETKPAIEGEGDGHVGHNELKDGRA
jgi:hypothetical protein